MAKAAFAGNMMSSDKLTGGGASIRLLRLGGRGTFRSAWASQAAVHEYLPSLDPLCGKIPVTRVKHDAHSMSFGFNIGQAFCLFGSLCDRLFHADQLSPL